jgi:predicted phosphodiesterase
MYILIISDTHFDPWYDPKKALFLKRLIRNADQAVINGDLWESFFWSFNDFIKSKWSELFPLLKAKNAIYIYGNHDAEHLSDKRAKLFSVWQLPEWQIELGGTLFTIRHGDEYDLLFQKWSRSFLGNLFLHNPLVIRLMLFVERLAMQFLDIHYSQKKLQTFNEEIKEKAKNKLLPHEFLITGHTHSAELDMTSRFANSGYIRNGLAQYLEITKAGQLILHEERYD